MLQFSPPHLNSKVFRKMEGASFVLWSDSGKHRCRNRDHYRLCGPQAACKYFNCLFFKYTFSIFFSAYACI